MSFNRPDRRDTYLLIKGAMHILVGYAYALAPVPSATRNSLSTATDYIPLWVYGCLWIAAGVYIIVAALSTRPIGGWTVGVFTPALWGVLYTICWLHGDPGRGWVLGGVFCCIAGAMYCACGLIDPTWTLRRNQRR